MLPIETLRVHRAITIADVTYQVEATLFRRVQKPRQPQHGAEAWQFGQYGERTAEISPPPGELLAEILRLVADDANRPKGSVGVLAL